VSLPKTTFAGVTAATNRNMIAVMVAIAFLFVRMLCDCFKPRWRLEAEILALRHQLNILQQRGPRRLHLRWADRALFIWLYRRCPRILDTITIVRPETIVRWHRMGFGAYWRWKSRPLGGRPRIGKEVRDLIRRMSFENPLPIVRMVGLGTKLLQIPRCKRFRCSCNIQSTARNISCLPRLVA
jgi:hypothetical protein